MQYDDVSGSALKETLAVCILVLGEKSFIIWRSLMNSLKQRCGVLDFGNQSINHA